MFTNNKTETMGGGLVQLVAYGAQDIYLTSNPQITFFKVVYRRHTNFAMESIEQTFNGTVGFGKRVTATISRNGDLIKDMWLEVDMGNTNTDGCYGVGNALVKQVELEIGGQLIDRQYGEWMNIWSELTVPEGKRAGYDEMVGNTPTLDSDVQDTTTGVSNTHKRRLDVPLMFWFNRNPGLALPLIALQYHEVKLNLDLETPAKLGGTNVAGADSSDLSCKLWVDYIYLDTDERRRFAQVSHEYLIEQVQFTGDETLGATGARVDLNYNHPVKELIWVNQGAAVSGVHPATGRSNNNACQFTPVHSATVSDSQKFKLQLNGHDRFTERRAEYFLNVQPFKHHTHMPRTNRTLCAVVSSVDVTQDTVTTDEPTQNVAVTQNNSQYIYVYSFALNPEELQPSGTCNFSRIDNATLVVSGACNTGTLKVFAVNYNVLRIMSGMGGLAYSN
jgi:hypothetical protein